MSQQRIQEVINRLPRLTNNGVRFKGQLGMIKLSKEGFIKKFDDEQKALLNDTESFQKICVWLKKVNKIKTINRKHSSYYLKHVAEQEIGYITNGVFIAAAIDCGFNFESDDSPNVFFNMSEKSIKQLVNGRIIL